MQRNQDNKISHTASWYDSSDRNNSWSVSASGDNDEFKDMKASLRASYQHNTETVVSISPGHHSETIIIL